MAFSFLSLINNQQILQKVGKFLCFCFVVLGLFAVVDFFITLPILVESSDAFSFIEIFKLLLIIVVCLSLGVFFDEFSIKIDKVLKSISNKKDDEDFN